MRHTFLRECGERDWTVDDLVQYDVPAILDYVERETGHDRVNWVGHSLGGMLVFPYLELAPHPRADRQLRRDGKHDHSGGDSPERHARAPTAGCGSCRSSPALGGSAGRWRSSGCPGWNMIDRFYYSNENVDRETISRFYGYTLEDTGPGALRQLDPYLEYGHMLSADRTIDYSARLGEITTPTLLVAGDGDIMSDVPSTELTFAALGSPDKAIMRFGKSKATWPITAIATWSGAATPRERSSRRSSTGSTSASRAPARRPRP